MSMAGINRAGRVMAGASGFLLLIACLFVCVSIFACDPAVYAQEPPFDRMAVETAEYLSGKRDALSEELFGAQERQHMADVKGLFEFGRNLALVGVVGGLLFLLAGLFLSGSRKACSNAFLAGMGVFALLGGALAAWAALDFTGWFTAMHRLAFRNDLWLFDASSPLIQMMPESFFVSAVKTVGTRLAICLGALALFSLATRHEKAAGRSRLL